MAPIEGDYSSRPLHKQGLHASYLQQAYLADVLHVHWQGQVKIADSADVWVVVGPMYQAGTLSGNPLAMVAGIKTLEILGRPGAYEHLDAVTGRLVEGLLAAGRDTGHAMVGGHISGGCPSLHPLLQVV